MFLRILKKLKNFQISRLHDCNKKTFKKITKVNIKTM